MPLQIIHASDPVKVTKTKILVYGQPGAGKTSLAFTAEKPFLLDFDDGAYRSGFRQDYGRVTSWADVSSIKRDDFANYRTIIIDTLDTALAFLQEQVIKDDAKNGNRNGGLSLPGYGVLKNRFSNWLTQLTLWGLDVIMIAHAKEEKEGDSVRVRPQITGSSYDFVIQKSDFIGFLHKINDKSSLSFSPCEKWYGKNSAGLPLLTIPDFKTEPKYFSGIIQQMKDALSQTSNAQAESVNKLKGIKEQIEALKNAKECNDYLVSLKSLDITPIEKKSVWEWLKAHGEKTLNCMFIKEDGKFAPPSEPEPEPELPQTPAAPQPPAQEPMPWEV